MSRMMRKNELRRKKRNTSWAGDARGWSTVLRGARCATVLVLVHRIMMITSRNPKPETTGAKHAPVPGDRLLLLYAITRTVCIHSITSSIRKHNQT